MKWLYKFFRLEKSDRLLLINTFLLLLSIRFGLWLLPFKSLRQLLSKVSQPLNPSQNFYKKDLNKIIRAVNVSSRYMPGGAKCLARALTTQILMNRYGYFPELRIGVAKGEEGKLEAHAWIEYQGKVVIGNLQDLSRFTPMPSFAEI
ncbi:MAG: lasso peptide biosynthesis B2 protein [Calothrix sp. MO_192.B10]|nr:lasso peptide biosynthesis B2 protein [Calothrix sp. MO_192.B10]